MKNIILLLSYFFCLNTYSADLHFGLGSNFYVAGDGYYPSTYIETGVGFDIGFELGAYLGVQSLGKASNRNSEGGFKLYKGLITKTFNKATLSFGGAFWRGYEMNNSEIHELSGVSPMFVFNYPIFRHKMFSINAQYQYIYQLGEQKSINQTDSYTVGLDFKYNFGRSTVKNKLLVIESRAPNTVIKSRPNTVIESKCYATNVYFKFGSSNVDISQQNKIDNLSSRFHNGYLLSLYSYQDSLEKSENLSKLRAKSIYNYLNKHNYELVDFSSSKSLNTSKVSYAEERLVIAVMCGAL